MLAGAAGGSNGGSVTIKAGESTQSVGGSVLMQSGQGGTAGGSLSLTAGIATNGQVGLPSSLNGL